ncbi:hypothetical protein PQQ87_08570 [Paraburkholderia nemoris]|uniref:hypothetical protein n=1 Tax=Paraburkholderia nemoris TaxID=2793076 RepID=UPI0038B99E42
MSTVCNGKGFPECQSCINRQHDPFECETCDDGSNYEPPEDDDEVDVMTIMEFRDWLEAA